MIALAGAVVAGKSNAAPLTRSVSSAAQLAAPNTADGATLLVLLKNADGTPKVDAVVKFDKGSPVAWTLKTVAVPKNFGQACTLQANQAPVPDPARLIMRSISPRNSVVNETVEGLYAVDVVPYVRCGQGSLFRWVQGEYHFVLTYSNGDDKASALGVLVIR